MAILIYFTFIYFTIVQFSYCKKYTPDWKSLDARPLPPWYDEAKFGIFAHWGVFAVPAFNSEWFWYNWKMGGVAEKLTYDTFVNSHFRNGTTYAEFASQFTAEDFDPKKFADVIKSSGARYFVLTSKHHEGYTLWPSSTSWNWNSVDVGPHRDLVGDLAESVRAAGIHFGTYFSLMDWFHPLYISDGQRNQSEFARTVMGPQLEELVTRYTPDVIWTDGDWDRSDSYWRSRDFLAWLYNDSPIKDKVAVNDRWGSNMAGHHGGFLTHNDEFDPGVLLERKWENCLKLDTYSWGYRRNIKAWDVLSLKTVILKLARTISCGGNLLLNIGPDRTGRILPIFEERLLQIGKFVTVNEEAIFGTRPWIYQNESNSVWYTSRLRNEKGWKGQRKVFNEQDTKDTIIYAFVVEIPVDSIVRLPSVKITNQTKVSLLGTRHNLRVNRSCASLFVDVSDVPWREWPSPDALVLKIEFAAPSNRNPLAENERRGVRLENVRAPNANRRRSRSPYSLSATVPTARQIPSTVDDISCEMRANLPANDNLNFVTHNTNDNDADKHSDENESNEKVGRNILVLSNF